MSRVPIRLPGKQSKYRNKRSNGFDSKREERRWQELRLLLNAGIIVDLCRQQRFTLDVNGEHICDYLADFSYFESDKKGSLYRVVEDCKGYRTREYKIKKRLMKACYGIGIRET